MFRSIVSASLMLSFLAGCASPPDGLSVLHKQALDQANQGEKAYIGGHPAQSRAYYLSAFQLNSRIENARGMAANTLSLAQINLDLGEYALADARLQAILLDTSHLFNSSEKADAAARSALLALLLKQTAKAADLAQQAQSLCKESNCYLMAAILNLHAQAALTLGLLADSETMAHEADSIAEKSQQRGELANSKRLLAQIQLQKKSAPAAITLFELALALDKKLGQAAKIAEDLHGLAEAKEMQGQGDEAAAYRRREAAIQQAMLPVSAAK